VGITRARQRLFLSSAWTRMLFGSTQYNPPSRFIEEIPAELVEEVGANRRTGGGGRAGRLGNPDAGRDRLVERAMRPSTPSPAAGGRLGGARPAPTPSNAHAMGFRVGEDVRHPRFGDGVIIGIEGEGDKAVATVRFPQAGERQLLLSWAPLERL